MLDNILGPPNITAPSAESRQRRDVKLSHDFLAAMANATRQCPNFVHSRLSGLDGARIAVVVVVDVAEIRLNGAIIFSATRARASETKSFIKGGTLGRELSGGRMTRYPSPGGNVVGRPLYTCYT